MPPLWPGEASMQSPSCHTHSRRRRLFPRERGCASQFLDAHPSCLFSLGPFLRSVFLFHRNFRPAASAIQSATIGSRLLGPFAFTQTQPRYPISKPLLLPMPFLFPGYPIHRRAPCLMDHISLYPAEESDGRKIGGVVSEGPPEAFQEGNFHFGRT